MVTPAATAATPGAVRSADGTTIGYVRTGQGAPAVLLHGTSADSASWAAAGPILARELTVYAVDRRGRGRSDLGEPHTFDAEVDDLAAVVESLDEPPHLVGHSFGAVIALAAAARGVVVRSLVLYEPPVVAAQHLDVEALAAACQEALDAEDREAVLRTFYAAIGQESAIDLFRHIPVVHQRFLDAAHTIPRELRASVDVSVDLAAAVTVPTLLVLGSASPELFRDSTARLAATLPDSTTAVLDGQAHLAHAVAPADFARAVLDFLRAQAATGRDVPAEEGTTR